MAIVYKKNYLNVYKVPLYAKFWVWLLLVVLFAVSSLIASHFLKFKVVRYINIAFWLLVAVLIAVRVAILIRSVIKVKSLKRYVKQRNAEKEVTKSLLATMSVNRLRDTPFIAVPNVTVCDRTPSHIDISIEKLPGMYDVDKLTEDINSSFRGKLGAYAVTSSMITSDGLSYKFVLEDVMTDKAWRPATIEDIKAYKYIIKLQDDLSINLSQRAHIAVWGRTGSKKTTVLFGMILQLFTMGADVRFIDGKDEFSSFKNFYPEEKIVSSVNSSLEQLAYIVGIVKERQKIMADEVSKRQILGLKASDVGLRPIVLIADEVGSIVSLMENKESKLFISSLSSIIQRGRSVGVSVIISTQDPSTDTLPQKIRQQFSTKILLGSTNSDIQRMAFGEVATSGDVEDFRGFYTCDGLTTQPMKYYVCDIYTHGFNDLKAFKKAYKIGLNVNYLHEA